MRRPDPDLAVLVAAYAVVCTTLIVALVVTTWGCS